MPTPVTSTTPLTLVSPTLPTPTQGQTSSLSVDTTVLPYTVYADVSISQIEILSYNKISYNKNPQLLSTGQHQFTGSGSDNTAILIDPTQGDVTIQILGRNYDPTVAPWVPSTNVWSAGTLFPLGYSLVDSNGYVQAVTLAGTSASSIPAFSTSIGNFTTDNGVIWKNLGYAPLATLCAWMASTGYALGYQVVDPNGYIQSVTNVTGSTGTGLSSTMFPSFSTVLGTSVTDGQLTWTNTGFITVTAPIKFVVIPYVSGSGALIGPPSAVRAYMAQNTCRIEWLEPTYAGVIGTRVMLSTDPTGINPTYVQYGDVVPPSQLSRSDTSVLATQSTSAYNGAEGTQTITTVNTVQQNNYNYVDVPQSDVGGAGVFYAMLSTVIQDPGTQAIFESQQNGPITCGYVNLKQVQLTDFLALQRKEDIAGRMISQVNRNYPNLDLSPRSELRDLMIDPVAIELSNMSVREWFSRISRSVSGLAQIDNTSGNGISDPYNSSPVKQQIARAYGLNATDTQTFIDSQFDVLGERAGLTRLGATSSVVTITFYTYVKPTSTVSFTTGIIVSTVADAQTPALNFITTGSSSIAANSINTYYDPINGWWSVSVPASCQSSGSNTNVGAGTINNVGSGAPAGWYCTNLTSAAFGQDDEINSSFAARILNRLLTGVDSGTRNGYLTTALATPGITSALVVAAGDTEMLRDWDNIRQKHVYGCVDIYAQGTSFSEQTDIIAFQYQNTGTFGDSSTYLTLTPFNTGTWTASIQHFSSLPYPLYQAVQLLVTSPIGSFYLGLTNAQFDGSGFIILNPNDLAYRVVGDSLSQVTVPLMLNGIMATNKAAITQLASQAGSTTYSLLARYQSPLLDTPASQPLTSVNSVIGQSTLTGTVDTSLIELIHPSDFLLQGGSNQAGDYVKVSTTAVTTITKPITVTTSALAVIDSAMSVTVDSSGNVGNVVSVRSTDQSTLYGFGPGQDYTIGATGAYHSYGLQPLQVTYSVTEVQVLGSLSQVVFTCNNKFGVGAQIEVGILVAADGSSTLSTILPSGTPLTVTSSDGLSFTATLTSASNIVVPTVAGSSTVTGYSIQNNQQVLVAYNKFEVAENLTLVSSETQTLSGTSYSILNNQGFVYNTWLPESYGNTTLTLDGWDGLFTYASDGVTIIGLDISGSTGLVGAQVPHNNRYIKVTYNNAVMRENVDYVLAVDAASGTAAIARSAANISTTLIPDGATVNVSYFTTEAFSIATEYPAFVEILANQLATTKHAAADVLVKAMVANPVDITMTVTLQSNVTADTLDPIIRSTIDLVLNNAAAGGTLYQSELVQQVMGITGVQTVNLPLVKCAKADGSYDVGVVIPTGTTWLPLSSDPAFAAITPASSFPQNSFITASPILPDSTIPSGGQPDAFVGLLYQGQAYNRTASIQKFLTTAALPQTLADSGSFYIIGTNDKISDSIALSSAYNQKVIITIPETIANPSLLSFFVTYQVYGEGSASDITMSSTEYLVPGRVTINYQTTGAN